MVSTSVRALLVLASVSAGTAALAGDKPVAVETVDTLNKIWGVHPGYRANHAKGQVVEGTFTPTDAGPKLSKAILFQGKPSTVTVRFSDSGGLPTLPDGAKLANPHGIAIKFHMPDASEMDIVANSLHFFPVADGEQFLELQQAVAASPPTAPKPTPLEKFLGSHPAAPKALGTAHTPSSLAREAYYGIDAFIFVDLNGKRSPFRFQIVPTAGTEYLTPDEAAKKAPDYLMEDIAARINKAPVTFDLLAQLANDGDQTKDPTMPWGDDRKVVKLGTITLDKVDPDSKAAEKKLLFLPTSLTDGIALSDDPLVIARSQAYGVSFGRRVGK